MTLNKNVKNTKKTRIRGKQARVIGDKGGMINED